MKKLKFCGVLIVVIMSIACFIGCSGKSSNSNETVKYTVSFASENSNYGDVSANIKDGNAIQSGDSLEKDTEVVLKATPKDGYSFDGWFENGANVSEALQVTVTLTKDISYVAKFSVNTYNLTVLSEDANKGTVSNNGGTKQYGEQITVIATPNEGYSFEGWYVDGQKINGADASYQFNMPASAYTLEARFSVNTYNLTVTSEDANKGTVSNNGGTKQYGEQITVTATPNEGYSFDGWYVGGQKINGADASYQFNMPASTYTLEARFSVNVYLLKFTSDNTSQGTVSGEGIVSPANISYNESVTVTATPNEGYSFDGWYVGGQKINGADAEYTFNMPLNGYEITAKFKINSRVITFSTEDGNKGTVTADGGVETGDEIEYNALLTLTATAKTGYEFEGWYKNGETKISNAQANYTFNMPDADYTLVAKFKAKKYVFSYACGENGSAQASVTTATEVDYGTQITLTATPDEGYLFDGWYDGATLVSDDAEYEFNMPAKNYTLQAKFKPNSFTLNFISEDSNKGTVSGTAISGNPVDYKKTVTVTATPKDGYSFEGWYVGGQKINDADSEYTFNMPASAYTLEARFSVNSYNLTVSSEDANKGTVSNNGGTKQYGEQITVTATPNEGYSFEGWYAESVWISDDAEFTFNMPASAYTLEARFSVNFYNLTVTSEDAEKGSVSNSSGKKEYGAEITVTATAEIGYDFEGWYVGGQKINAESEYTFNMPANEYALVAKFVAEKKTVTFYDGNIVVLTQEIDYNTPLSELDNAEDFSSLSKDGYSFLGWTTERNGTTTYVLSSLVKDDFNLYAKWEETIVYYAVEFRYEDNSVGLATTVEKGEKITQVPAPKEIEGYEFSRWYYIDGTQAKQTFDKDTFTVLGDTVIYAEYNILSFNVTFVYGNGENDLIVPVDYNQTVARPTQPTKDGYDFVDWYVGDAKFLFNTPITDNLTVTAKWQEVIPDSYKVSFYKDGELIHTQTVVEGDFASIPTGVSKTGYTLTGWFYLLDSVETEFTEQTAITADIDVYAKFEKLTFSVTFVGYNAQGVLGTLKEETVAYQDSATAPADPTREGYTFEGWDKAFDSVTQNLTVNATYEIITYTVKYMDGSSQIGDTVTVNYGEKLSVPANPEKDRYAFAGWYTSVEFNASFNFAETAITKDTVIYAKFVQEIFTVTFKGYNGEELSVIEVRKGDTAQTPSAPAVEGYTFDGWDKAFTNIQEDTVITAIYTQITYTVTFLNKDGGTILSETVAHGSTAKSVAPAEELIPDVENMEFVGWDKNVEIYVIKEDTTFTAQYKFVTKTVEFYLDEGDAEPYATVSVSYGSKVNLPNTPPQNGTKIFDYWYIEGESEPFNESTAITDNVKLYAKYKEIGDRLTVTFYGPDGEKQFGNIQLVQKGGYAIEPAPYADGYVWCLSGTNEPFDFDTPINEDTVLIAVEKQQN